MKIVFDKKPQFSKVWLAACIIISLVFTASSYLLAMLDKAPLAELASEIIQTLWGASGTSFVGYAIQNCVRAYTSSRFGLPGEYDETEEENGDIHE